MKKLLIVLGIVFTMHSQVSAETIISCGSNNGYEYFFSGGIVPKSQEGWGSGGFSTGHFSLIRYKSNNQLDVIYKDATNVVNSARANGAEVVMLSNISPIITVLVNYKNQTTEIYTFDVVKKNYSYSQHKYGKFPIKKVATYVGKCY